MPRKNTKYKLLSVIDSNVKNIATAIDQISPEIEKTLIKRKWKTQCQTTKTTKEATAP